MELRKSNMIITVMLLLMVMAVTILWCLWLVFLAAEIIIMIY